MDPERYGRVRFQGSFVSPTQYFGCSSQQYMPSANQAQVEVQRLRDQMAQMQATTIEVQRKYEELQLQLKAEAEAREAATAAREAEAAAREAEQSKKYDELQQQLQIMMKMFKSQLPPS